MGASLNDPAVKKQLDELQADTAKAQKGLDLAALQTAIDAAGLVDPTPISDLVGGVLSAATGDWFGAAMSLVSMLPYAGDAIGKTAKGARLVAKIAKWRKRIADNVIKGRQIVANAVKKDAAAIRAKRAADKAKRIDDAVISGCPVGGNRFGTQSPKNGWADGAERGNGPWDPKQSGLNQDRIDDIESVTGGKPIQFKEGYPDYTEYRYKAKGPDGKPVDGAVEIKLDPTGNRDKDFAAANQAMAEKLGVDKFKEPDGYTWHHKEDGTTMELVPSDLHNNVPHSGGVSLAKDPAY
jgi:hypothetical protein